MLSVKLLEIYFVYDIDWPKSTIWDWGVYLSHFVYILSQHYDFSSSI